MIVFDKIVKKLFKKRWKVISKNDIFEIIDPELKSKYSTKLDKIIYTLKSQKILMPIKAWIYIVPDDDDFKLNKIDLLEKYFYKLLKKYITTNCQNHYYISWNKSLEIHLKDYSVPDKIYIVNRNINKKIIVWDYQIIFKQIKSNIKGKSINIYNKLSKMTKTCDIDWIKFKISNLELSLLENSLVIDNENWVNLYLINKALKKYHNYLDKDNFYYIWSINKYIMSFNRLKELSKNIDRELYEVFLDIIKINWWLFIWEWLRKI